MPRKLRSRREENRAATHRAIVDAAFDLVSQGGAESLTVDAVADRAGVSRRTFFNYFGSLEAALTDPTVELLAAAVEELDRRPAEEHPLDSVRACLAAALSVERVPRMVEQFRVCQGSPAALRHHAYTWRLTEDKVLDVLARRTGGEDPVYAQTVASAAFSVLERTVVTWLRSAPEDATPRLDDLFTQVDRAFTYLADGLRPQPVPSQN